MTPARNYSLGYWSKLCSGLGKATELVVKDFDFVVFLLGVELVRPGVLSQEFFRLSLDAIVGDHDLGVDFDHRYWTSEKRFLFVGVGLFCVLVYLGLLVLEGLKDGGFLERAAAFNRHRLRHQVTLDHA